MELAEVEPCELNQFLFSLCDHRGTALTSENQLRLLSVEGQASAHGRRCCPQRVAPTSQQRFRIVSADAAFGGGNDPHSIVRSPESRCGGQARPPGSQGSPGTCPSCLPRAQQGPSRQP